MKDFNEIVEWICRDDTRYQPNAYHFVREGLDFTMRQLEGEAGGGSEKTSRHVRGQELLEGLRDYALEQFGSLSLSVLNHWGVKRCEDFGEIVFNLVDCGALGKTEEDSREDFVGCYDFEAAFNGPFLPPTGVPASVHG